MFTKIIAMLTLALVSISCSLEESSSPSAAIDDATTTTAAPTTTTAAPTTTTTTTTTTTIPDPRWEWDKSYRYNTQNLIGAPIDPLLLDQVNELADLIDSAGSSMNQRYWASYVAAADITCVSLEEIYDLGIEENWNQFEADMYLELWIEEVILMVQRQPGLASLDQDEAMDVAVAGVVEQGCKWTWDFFVEFIEG